MLEFIVKMRDSYFSISENGIIKKLDSNPSKFDILVVKEVSKEVVERALNDGYKVYSCNSVNTEECLREVLNLVFPSCRECKFI